MPPLSHFAWHFFTDSHHQIAAALSNRADKETERICSDAIQTTGGAGYMTDYGVERICRAVRFSKIYEGTNDIQRLLIGRAIVAESEQEQRH